MDNKLNSYLVLWMVRKKPNGKGLKIEETRFIEINLNIYCKIFLMNLHIYL